ncbi:MAG: hypothetical protein JWQ04_3160 [Pedosphaera sp.]|nr:hypothetical protein [Pedosphaera sp.]
MKIQEVMTTINQMQADGIIGRYAIGGAVGATFYLEPVATLDVDVFVILPAKTGELFIILRPLFDYLKDRGCVVEGEHIVISGWPVQFLPPTGPLVEEALEKAVEKEVGDISVRVFTSEHLAAIALQTGRAKDKARLLQFLEAGVLNAERFQHLLARHGLMERWRQFEKQFLGDQK